MLIYTEHILTHTHTYNMNVSLFVLIKKVKRRSVCAQN